MFVSPSELQIDSEIRPAMRLLNRNNSVSLGPKFAGRGPDNEFMEISMEVKFSGNGGICPVNWLELKSRFTTDMNFKSAGKPPLRLFCDTFKNIAFEKALQNQCGILSLIPVAEMWSSLMSTIHCSQAGNEGPIWQVEKSAY
jgi:hypothetical protein